MSDSWKKYEENWDKGIPITLGLPYGRLGCQLDCAFCHSELREDSRGQAEIERTIHNIYSRLEPIMPDVQMIRLVDWGEPFLVRYLSKLLNYIFSLNKDAHIQLVTNLNTYSKDVIQMLARRGNTEILVSVNATNESTYQKIMGKRGFEKTIQNIFEINDLKSEGFPQISLSFVGCNENIWEFPEFVKLGSSLNAKLVALQDLIINNKDHFELQLNSKDRIKIHDCINKAKMIASNCGIDLVFSSNPPDLFFDNSSKEFKCYGPFTSFLVNSMGFVSCCCYSKTTIGNVLKEDPRDIWQSKKIWAIRQGFLGKKLAGDCKKCKNNFYGAGD